MTMFNPAGFEELAAGWHDLDAVSEGFTAVPEATDVPPTGLYGHLQRALREADEKGGTGILQRYLSRMEEQLARHAQKVWRLPRLVDPAKVPAQVLEHLRAHVGFGPGSGQPEQVWAHLDTAAKRKLISVAVQYWRRRGRRDALESSIAFLAAKARPAVDDWFWTRWLVDEVLLGVEGGPGSDPWVSLYDPLGAGGADGYAGVSIRVPDFGGLDRQLVLELCQLARPLSEQYDVAFVDWLDTMKDGKLGHWSPRGMVAAEWLAGDSTLVPPRLPGLVLGEHTEEYVDVPLASTWGASKGYWLSTLINWRSRQPVRIRFYVQGTGNFYSIALAPPATLEFGKTVAGMYTAIKTVAADLEAPAVRGVWINVEPIPSTGKNCVQVWLDAELVLEDTTDSTYGQGGVQFDGAGAPVGDPVVLHRSELYQHPLEWWVLARNTMEKMGG